MGRYPFGVELFHSPSSMLVHPGASSNSKPLTPAVPGGFTLDDFTIDDQAVTCPGGHTRTMS